jgi:hypothetical protein
LWIALNFGGEPVESPFSGEGSLVRSTADAERIGPVSGAVALAPREGVIVERRGG